MKHEVDYLNRPVFILGLPRSGTSMVAGIVGICGAWLGYTVGAGGGKENPKGFFENRKLREDIVKPILTGLGCDPLGVLKLPGLNSMPPSPGLKKQVTDLITQEGYCADRPWAFKDAKLTLLWPMFQEAFPDASWVIVNRNIDGIVKSCMNTSFMAQHSGNPELWYAWSEQYTQRLKRLAQTVENCYEIQSEDLIVNNYRTLQTVIERLGLRWDRPAVDNFICRDYWHSPPGEE